jgi:hypothetical protein
MSDVVASGTITVRDLDSGREWDEIVEVFERDMDDAADEVCVEDVARRVAQNQALPRRVETLGADLS